MSVLSVLVVDDAMAAKFAAVTQPSEVRDRSGKRLGSFTPDRPVPWEPDVTEEELDRRMQEPGHEWSEVRQRFVKP